MFCLQDHSARNFTDWAVKALSVVVIKTESFSSTCLMTRLEGVKCRCY